ncbi:MAG TPA: hypothetical protein VHM66_10550 [Solirubrobacterales bacterium]|nr:hypothetical protein [Solirubrobacterales bacterium]
MTPLTVAVLGAAIVVGEFSIASNSNGAVSVLVPATRLIPGGEERS